MSAKYQYVDAGEAHDPELKACPFEYQLCMAPVKINQPERYRTRRTTPTESCRQSIDTRTTFNFIDDDLTTSFYTIFGSLRVIKSDGCGMTRCCNNSGY